MTSICKKVACLFLTFFVNAGYAQSIPIQMEKNIKTNAIEGTSNLDIRRCKKPPYPRKALIADMEGDSVLLLKIGETGIVEEAEITKSSGWRILDDAISKSILGCKITDTATDINLSKTITFRWWTGGENNKIPVKMLKESCRTSELVRFAEIDELGRGIVVGVHAPRNIPQSEMTIEWSSGQSELDLESVDVIKSCKFKTTPETLRSINLLLNGPFSVRFLPRP